MQDGRRGLLAPIVLLGLGGLLLVHSLGLLPAEWWPRLGQLWPVLLVLVGLDMLIGRRSAGRVAAVLLLTTLVAAAALTWASLRGP